MSLSKAREPFAFKSQLSLVELTGLKAADLAEMSEHLKRVPEASVYYHTHHFLQQHQFLTPEPPNDFAYWVKNVLQEELLGEELAAIDTVQFTSLKALREAIVSEIDSFLERDRTMRKAPPGQEFHFMQSVLFTLPTSYLATDLREFSEGLKRVSMTSLYYHIFEARLRPPFGINDFSLWLEKNLEEHGLAREIARLDPYTHTMEALRKRILYIVEERIKKEELAVNATTG